MYHELPRGARFWNFLYSIDCNLADIARQKGCPSCGGCLHSAKYPRQPRSADGDEPFPDSYKRRLSFCCDRDGCRKRVTPPSVRFLGRKLYLGAVVVLVSAMRQGPTPRRVRELSELFGADRRTIARWQVFWRDRFPYTPFWKTSRGRLPPSDDDRPPPLCLLAAFLRGVDLHQEWKELLLFLSPISTATGPPCELAS